MGNNIETFLKIVPSIMMVLAFITALLYLWYGDYKQAVYWSGAFALNYSIIWM